MPAGAGNWDNAEYGRKRDDMEVFVLEILGLRVEFHATAKPTEEIKCLVRADIVAGWREGIIPVEAILFDEPMTHIWRVQP